MNLRFWTRTPSSAITAKLEQHGCQAIVGYGFGMDVHCGKKTSTQTLGYFHCESHVPPAGTTPKAARFTEDAIRREGLPKDVMGLIHDLAYDHEGRDRWQYKLRAQQILMSEAK